MKYSILSTFLIVLFISCNLHSPKSIVINGELNLREILIIGNEEVFIIEAGTVISSLPEGGILVIDGGKLVIEGRAELPVIARQAASSGYWYGIRASGEGSSIEIAGLRISGGPIVAIDGSSAVVTDSILESYINDIAPIAEGWNARVFELRRSVVRDFYEIHFYGTPALVDGCVLEGMVGDGIDFDNSPSGSIVRNTTIRNAPTFNVDGIDFGTLPQPYLEGSHGLVELCDIYGISDKGISIGETAVDIRITDTLVRNVGIGIASKDSSEVFVDRTTIFGADVGISLYEERSDLGGGNIYASGIIVWSSLSSSFFIGNGSILHVQESCIPGMEGANGNVADDPLFNTNFNPSLPSPIVFQNMGFRGRPGASTAVLFLADSLNGN